MRCQCVDVDVQLGVDDLDEGELVIVTADGKVPLKACNVFAVNDVESKMLDDHVVCVHDVFLIVLPFEVAIFDVALFDVDVVPIFVVVFLPDYVF